MAQGDAKPVYGTRVDFTVTNLHSLADNAWWQSAVQDNSTNKYADAHLQGSFVVANSGASANDKGFSIYAYGSSDGGTTYTEGASGSEGSFTPATDRQLHWIGFVPGTVINSTYKTKIMSVAAAFGGMLPQRWGIVLFNRTGFPFASSGSTLFYLPVYENVAPS